MKYIFLDIDGTLIPTPSCELRFFIYLLKIRAIGIKSIFYLLYFMIRRCFHYGSHIHKKNKAYLHGLNAVLIADHAKQFVTKQIFPLFRNTVVNKINFYRQQGYSLVLLTGTISFIAHSIAELME